MIFIFLGQASPVVNAQSPTTLNNGSKLNSSGGSGYTFLTDEYYKSKHFWVFEFESF